VRWPARKFTSPQAAGDDPPVRALPHRTAVLVLAFACAACSSTTTSRRLPASALVDRARSGAEPPAGPRARAVVAFAAAQIGHGYCWGGRGPSCFDCSGLVGRAWESVGVRLPRTSSEMGEALADVPLDDVRAGDILWWPGHVGVYAGDGWAIEALDSRHGIVRRPARNPYRVLRPPGVD
jgi:cell wall-associated NlpC family hydrolase